MKIFARLLSCALLLFQYSPHLFAEEPARMSLPELVAEAVTKNPERQFYEAAIQEAHAQRALAGRLPPPEVHTGVGVKRSRDFPTGIAGEGIAWSVGVSQAFEWPGRLSLRKAIANQDVELAELGYRRFVQTLRNRTQLQGLTLVGGRERAEVAGKVATRLHELREMLIQRDPAGITPILEIRILEATELTLRKRAAEAQLLEDSARVELNLLRGQPSASPLNLENVAIEIPGNIPSADLLLSAAQTNNFELRSRASELRQQGFRIELARNERWPSLTIGPQFSEENSISQDRQAGVALSLPLPLWRDTASHVEAAKARRIQAEALLATARREVERRIINALHSWQTKATELSLWQPDSIEQFRSAADLADRHFRLGAVPAATYVEIQRQYLEAIETLLNTRREALENALELEVLSGLDLTHSVRP